MQLKHVNDGEITGIWVLSPRSTFLLNPNQSITGRRSSISLEAWGGGEANVSVGKFTADGPIAWNVKPSRSGAATLHLTSQSGKIALQFASFNDRMCLACEVPHPQNGKPQIIRFLKASDRPAKSSLPFH